MLSDSDSDSGSDTRRRSQYGRPAAAPGRVRSLNGPPGVRRSFTAVRQTGGSGTVTVAAVMVKWDSGGGRSRPSRGLRRRAAGPGGLTDWVPRITESVSEGRVPRRCRTCPGGVTVVVCAGH